VGECRVCPACDGRRGRRAFEADGFWMARCPDCRSIFVDPRPDDALLASVYAREQDTAPAERLGTFLGHQAHRRARTLARMGLRRVLEVGSAAGEFLDALRDQGLEAEGVEPGPAADAAEAKGHRVHRCWIQRMPAPATPYDAVVLWEVLEHLPEPAPALAAIRSFVRPGGIVALSTPSISGVPARVLGRRFPMINPPQHLTLFSRRGLWCLMDRAGLDVTSWRSFSGLGIEQLASGFRKYVAGESRPARTAARLFAPLAWVPAQVVDLAGLGTEFEVYCRARP
jgi:SAM-dependent methyltransferase